MATVEEQAVVFVNEVRAEREQELWKDVGDRRGYGIVLEALCRAIEQHEAAKQEHADLLLAMHALMAKTEEEREAFRQEVSDAAEVYEEMGCPMAWEGFEQFIIPKPKPDPLVDVAKMMGYFNTAANHWAGDVRAVLDALGFEIRKKNDD